MSAKHQAADATSISEAWIEEQLKNFPPGSMDGAVRMLRAFGRADRRAAAARAVKERAA